MSSAVHGAWTARMPNVTDSAARAAVPAGSTRIHVVPLAIAVAITGVITVYPYIATSPDGGPDHLTAVLLLWSMSAGYVRGVGFMPRHVLPRGLLSSAACLGSLALALLRIGA
jgi:predicted membrane protein